MRLEQLKYLVEIANCRSINKAAQNLYITQPALSIAINALEEELNYPLLKRTNKGVVLTEDGQRVLVEAQMILDTIQNWHLDKTDQAIHLEGVVHILAIPSVCVALSNTLICNLQETHPNLSVFLHENSRSGDLLHTLENGAINIGIAAIPQRQFDKFCRKAEAGNWQVEKLASDQRCILLSAKNPLSDKTVLTTEDLQQLVLAYYSERMDDVSGKYRQYFDQKRSFRLSNRESIMQLIVENRAVGIFPDVITRSMYFRQNGLIKALPIADMDMHTFYVMLHPDIKLMSVNEIRMMSIIREEFLAYEGKACC